MKRSAIVILSFGFLVGSIANSGKVRIVGGEDASISDYPYQVSLRVFGEHLCGGSIISEYYVLTAAHCVKGLEPAITVHTGTNSSLKSGSSHTVADIKIHPEYEDTYELSYHNDLAIVKLAQPIEFDKNQQPIPLASHQAKGGEKGTLTGWGNTSPKVGDEPIQLQKVETEILDHDVCTESVTPHIYDEQICVFRGKGFGTCYGDSGGPLAIDGKLVGVSSWITGKACADGNPEIYTNVYAYRDWIRDNTK